MKKLLVSLGVLSVVLAGSTAVTFAAIPDTSGVIHSCYNSGLLPSFKIYDPGAGQACGLGQTALTWTQNGGSYFATGSPDSIVADSSGIVTHAHTTPFTVSCNTGDFAEEGIFTASGTGATAIIGPPYTFDGDRTTLSSFTDSSATGYNVGDNTGIPNANITLKFYVLCLPVPTLPS